MNLKRKIPSFIFGLSIGLLLGVAFFVFKLTDIFDSIKSSAKEQVIITEKKVDDVSQNNYTSKENRFKINLGKNNKVNYHEVDSLINDDLKIASDELISVKNVKLISFEDIIQTDTVPAKLAGVVSSNSNLYFVEFWKTPLNSKGYRFTKNKVMLYGFVDYINIDLYQLENSYYIKCSDQVYKLEYSSDFKPLERVVDAELLAKIN
ncbi:MAG: hypothetical protein IM600_08030 [Bacteroidetes bacterium]|jgi:hypothetical protein|nr:hypothetical protein [Bacteroidota bacterium]MCA6443360.1 hypothetical protein [Bacteroidota bacterium]